MGFTDGLMVQLCHKLSKKTPNLEMKYKQSKTKAISEFKRNCAKIHYGIELWDKDKIDQEKADEAILAAEKIKIDGMLKQVDDAQIYCDKVMSATLMKKKLLEIRLEEELSYLESLLKQRETLINEVPQVTKYREGKDDEEPLSNITFSLSQLLNYPDRQDRPAR